ncbi:CaiB/BaiF CoA transferase family protein [Candidatus Poriferisodalis sp.]|uniref:CaiB/BaiF CoA transferase family protein n=1 Tax=Candidatus Poriferisodalis sp. TaxID=3101277 RepID=UPI003B01F813
MAGPMEGIRVVELGVWIAGPACGGILADWGAEVLKVETPEGDPFRSLEWLYPGEGNPPFDLDNRGKRSIALDLRHPDGLAALHRLLGDADVFVSNIRPGGLERMGLDYPSLAPRYPRLIYASVTGLSLRGDERDRQTYDVGAFWPRAGIVRSLTPADADLPYQRGGMGDHMTGLAAAAGVAAALFHRTSTGKGQLVESSLMRLGTYMLGWDHNVTAMTGADTEAWGRDSPPNPLINCYRCSDGEWLWMLGLEGDRHWPNVVRALDRPAWENDPRFADIVLRLEHAKALTSEMDAVMATRTRAAWGEIFDANDVWWAPVQSTAELRSDAQAHAAGCWVTVPTPDGGTVEMVATPVDFSESSWAPGGPSPEIGQHTELILVEHGYGWDDIEQLKQSGVIP